MTSDPTTTKHLVAILKVLQTEFPGLDGVRIRRRAPAASEQAWATCEVIDDDDGAPDHFLVLIDPVLNEPAATWALLHELAHVLSWSAEGNHDPSAHTPEWGLSMARLYTCWERMP
jgi:hypothetical protein